MPVVVPVFIALIPVVAPVLITIAVSVVVDIIIEKIFAPDATETRDQMQEQTQAAARARALLVNKNSNNAGIPLVYGKYRLGGTRVYLETSNNSGSIDDDDAGNEYFNMVLAMCEGEMGSIKEVYFGDIKIWNGSETGTATNGSTLSSGGYTSGNEYSGIDRTIVYHSGADGQAYDTMMKDSVGSGNWGSSHKLSGIAYLAIKIRANAEAFAGGVPVITAVLEGKKIRNVNTMSSTLVASAGQNPADVIYDYLTNTTYGKGLDHDEDGTYSAGLDIDLTSFATARANCISAWNGAGIKVDGPISTEQKLYENIQRLTKSCNGMLIWTGGKYKLLIQNDSETSQYSFNEDNIIGQMAVQKAKKASRVNKVTAGFTDSALNYVDNISVTDTGENGTNYLSADNGTVLEASMDHQLTTNSAFVTRLNEFRIDKSRNQLSIAFNSTHAALKVECGDIVSVSQKALDWTNKLFRVVTMEINEKDEVVFGAVEYVASIQI